MSENEPYHLLHVIVSWILRAEFRLNFVINVSDKPRTVVMDKEKGEPVVVIKEEEEESKEAKEGAPSERAKSITSSHSKDPRGEQKKEEKKDVLSFDKIKVLQWFQ